MNKIDRIKQIKAEIEVYHSDSNISFMPNANNIRRIIKSIEHFSRQLRMGKDFREHVPTYISHTRRQLNELEKIFNDSINQGK